MKPAVSKIESGAGLNNRPSLHYDMNLFNVELDLIWLNKQTIFSFLESRIMELFSVLLHAQHNY